MFGLTIIIAMDPTVCHSYNLLSQYLRGSPVTIAQSTVTIIASHAEINLFKLSEIPKNVDNNTYGC